MLTLDRLLCRLDAAADELRLNRDPFFHAQSLKQLRHPLFRENAHEVVFEREVEARGAGIALTTGASAQLIVDAAGFMAFRAENVQPANGGNLVVFLVGLFLVAAENIGPLIRRHGVFIAVVIEDGSRAVFLRTLDLALSHTQLLRDSLLHQLLLSHEFRVTTQQNVGAAASHVGGDGDHAFPSGLRYKLSLALVELGIQYDMLLQPFLLQQFRKALRLFNGGCTDQHRLTLFVELLNFVGYREVLFFLGAENYVWILQPQHLLIGRNNDDLEFVNIVELGCFGFCRARHPRQLLKHAEVILKRDRRQRLILALNLHAFFGFNRLMQAIGPAPAGHHASRKFINDDDLALFDDVLDVAAIQRVRLDRGLNVMLEWPVLRIGNVADPKKLLNFFPAFVGNRNVTVLLIDHKVARQLRGFAGSHLQLFTFFQLRNDAVDAVIFIGRFLARARNDQRRAGFVDQDRIHLIDDGKIVAALHAIFQIELHVVAQVVEAELIVGAVSNVGGVSSTALLVVEVVDDHAHRKAQETIELAHPFRVALGQIVVDGNHVHAASAESIEIDRKRGDQRLAFAGLHFRNHALVLHHAANQLHVEMTHVEHTAAGLAHHGKSFYQDFIQNFLQRFVLLFLELFRLIDINISVSFRLHFRCSNIGDTTQPLLNALPELFRLSAELVVGELPHLRFEGIDGLDPGYHALDDPFVLGPKDLAN